MTPTPTEASHVDSAAPGNLIPPRARISGPQDQASTVPLERG